MNMQLLNLIIQPLLGAAAGYITNEYAINMLFKSYTPLKLGGVIPKTREAFIENVSTLVEEDIINKDKVEAILKDKAFTKNFDALIKDFLTNNIYEVTYNSSIADNPLVDKALSNIEEFIKNQIELNLPELIESLTKQVKLSELANENQISAIIEKLYLYLLDVIKDTQLTEKLVKNIIDENENISLVDIIGNDNTAIITQNISDLLINTIDNTKPVINELIEKLDISNTLYDFFIKFITDNQDKLQASIVAMLDELLKSKEFKETLNALSQGFIEYFKNYDLPLFSLVDSSCINNFRDILYREYEDLYKILLNFVTSNKSDLQIMIEEAVNDTINEQDSAKKAVLSMAKSSIFASIMNNDLSDLASGYFNNPSNKVNLCALASAKLKDSLKSTTISQVIETLEKKGSLNANSLSEFLFTYINNNIDSIANTALVYIKKRANDEKFKNDLITKLKSSIFDKLLLSKQSNEFLNKQANIYLVKILNIKLKDFLITNKDNNANSSNFSTNEDLLQSDFNFNENLYNYLENNKEKFIHTISINIEKAIENKSIYDVLNEDLEANINMLTTSYSNEKISKIKEDIKDEKLHNIYDKLNSINNLHENSSRMLRQGVINNLGSLLHKFVKGLSVKNLSQLDDDNLVEMAQSFIGNNLKPIMIFGAMLGLIAGFILAFIQPNNNIFAVVSLSGIITCALVGFLTNAIAIAMLFKPYKEIKILRKVPFFRHFSLGYIAKNTENLADGMSQAISDYLLTKESMNDLIDSYEDSIKTSMINAVSNNNYQLLSDILINNKDKISSSITDYIISALSNNKIEISTAIEHKLEDIKLNEIIGKTSSDYSLSKYIINSKPYISESIYKYFSEIEGNVPEQLVDNIIKLAKNASSKGYAELISKLDFDNFKGLALRYDKNYQELIDKSIAEFFSLRKLLTLDKSQELKNEIFKTINKFVSSDEKLGDVFNKKISLSLNNFLYNYIENIEMNSAKLLIPMHAQLSKMIKNSITSKLNLLAKISYGMVGGDKIVDSVVKKILSDKLPKLLAKQKTTLHDSCSNYLNTNLLNIKLSELGLSLNMDTVTSSELQNINNIISPAVDLFDRKLASIKFKDLLESLSLESIDSIFSSHNEEISDLVKELSSKLRTNKNELLSTFTVFIDNYLNNAINNINLKQVFNNINPEAMRNISQNIVNIIFEENLVNKNINIALSYINNYDKKLYLSELVYKNELKDVITRLIENMIVDSSDSIKPILVKTIDKTIISASENGFAFINNESKDYLLRQCSDAIILSLRNNLSTMLNEIEFDKIAKEQISEMSPKKIHMMFDSFAGKYFRTLIIYGFWGAIFGINKVLGLALVGVYIIKNMFIKKVS